MNFAAVFNLEDSRLDESMSPCPSCRLEDCCFRKYTPPKEAIKYLEIARGEWLECRENACLRFWIVMSGHAATCTCFRDGRRQILSIECEGDAICGAMAARDSEQKLEALTDCRICEIDLSRWAAQLREDCAFLAMTFQLLHARLVKSTAHVATLGRLDSNERVTYFLAEMAMQNDGADGLVTLPMSREDIADYLGLNTDSVSRILSRIRKSGLFRFVSPTEYTVPDMGAVARRLPVAIPQPSHNILATRGHAT